MNHDILDTFGRFGLSQTLRRLGLEKQQGISTLQLILSANIVSNEEMLKKYIVMAEALEELEEAA